MNKPVNGPQLAVFEAFCVEIRSKFKAVGGGRLTAENLSDMWANLPEVSTPSPKGSPHHPDRELDCRHSWSGRGSHG